MRRCKMSDAKDDKVSFAGAAELAAELADEAVFGHCDGPPPTEEDKARRQKLEAEVRARGLSAYDEMVVEAEKNRPRYGF